VFEAGNAFDATEAVHKGRVDFVVLDWVLPDMPGIDLCRKLKVDAHQACFTLAHEVPQTIAQL
jgi:DNA-binding response OmpR family regulator